MQRILLCAMALLCLAGCASGAGGTPSQPTVAGSTEPIGISSEEATLIAPLAPATVTAEVLAGDVRLSWPATGEDLTAYVCLRRPAGSTRWTVIGRAAAGQTTMLDRQPAAGTYVYAVQAVGLNGRSSSMTESPAVVIG